MKRKTNFAQPVFIMLLTLTVIVVAAVLKTAAAVIMPVVMAILFSFVFEPLLLVLHKKFHIPWGLGILIVLIIVIATVSFIGFLLVSSISTIVELYPKYEARFNLVYKTLALPFDLKYSADQSFFQNIWGELAIRESLQNFALSLSNTLISFFKVVGLIALFAIFFSLDMRFLREKIQYAFGNENSSKARISKMITDLISQVTRYLSVKFTVSAVTGILVFITASLSRLDFPVVWAFLAFVFNFIPTFGSIMSVMATSGFAVLQFFPQPGPMLFVFIATSIINFSIGNIIEPKIMGRNLGLSPFVIIVALSFWGWLWNFSGLVIAVPMMVILKIICENFEFTKPLALIMGPYKPTIEGVAVAAGGEEKPTQ